MDDNEPIPIKLVIVGDGVVGKTCILTTYSQNRFPTEYVPTIFDNNTTTIKVDNTLINLSLWDTAGQQQYNRLRPLAYPSADVFLIAFSVVDPASFINSSKKWYPEICQANSSAIKLFVGNKTDLRGQNASQLQKDAQISKQTARKIFQQELKCKYYECSALLRTGIAQIFQNAVREVLIQRKNRQSVSGSRRQQKNTDQCCTIM